MKRTTLVILSLVLIGLVLAGCRNETQNRIRRNIQDFTGQRMYVTLYSYDGDVVFEGLVDGKVTRSLATEESGGEQSLGSYVYWYDERGRYHQSSLPYLLTSYDRNQPSP